MFVILQHVFYLNHIKNEYNFNLHHEIAIWLLFLIYSFYLIIKKKAKKKKILNSIFNCYSFPTSLYFPEHKTVDLIIESDTLYT